MDNKTLPFDRKIMDKIISEYGSPVYVYDEKGIRDSAKRINKAFSWAKGYKNYFAVKATPTPSILKILQEEGMGFDCSSYAELKMIEKLGIAKNDIFFTSNNTVKEEFELAIELGAVVNIDDISQVPVFIESLNGRGYPYVALRYNPGNLQSGNEIIGLPEEAKFGMSLEDIVDGFDLLSSCNIKEYGLHTMIASNELNTDYFAKTAEIMKDAISQVEKKIKKRISFINLGGGFGVNYRPEENPFNVEEVANKISNILTDKNLEILTENGRYVTGPHGYLITKVNYVMKKHRSYIGVDASMHNLMRPGMYGAYHHISVLGKSGNNATYDVVGSLCENNDKFAINRRLPEVVQGDVLVIHDAGAHGHSMGFNYNGKLKSAEIICKENGDIELIRRAENLDDYFSTLVW